MPYVCDMVVIMGDGRIKEPQLGTNIAKALLFLFPANFSGEPQKKEGQCMGRGAVTFQQNRQTRAIYFDAQMRDSKQ